MRTGGKLNEKLESWWELDFAYRNLEVQNVPPGTEPLYTLDADIFQAFVSFWF